MNDALQVAFLCVAGIGAIGIFLPMPALGLGMRWRGFTTFLLGAIAAIAFAPAKPKPAAPAVQPSRAVTHEYTRNARALFSKSGRGDDVFDLPPDPGPMHIHAAYSGDSSNFIVYLNGRPWINEVIGTQWDSTVYDGTLLPHGGTTVEITDSSGVSWSFAERP
jgi:hypothetical protein